MFFSNTIFYIIPNIVKIPKETKIINVNNPVLNDDFDILLPSIKAMNVMVALIIPNIIAGIIINLFVNPYEKPINILSILTPKDNNITPIIPTIPLESSSFLISDISPSSIKITPPIKLPYLLTLFLKMEQNK